MTSDDSVAAFHLDGAPVRGRYARLDGATIDPILHRHDYPRPVALLLGEALTLVALIGSLLNIEGRLVLQAEGEGPVSMLVAEWRSGGALRGYARISNEARAALARENAMAQELTPPEKRSTERVRNALRLIDDVKADRDFPIWRAEYLRAQIHYWFLKQYAGKKDREYNQELDLLDRLKKKGHKLKTDEVRFASLQYLKLGAVSRDRVKLHPA